jgi:diguanylate cyclase (GGDEF)-like protein/PAS domain S-box-containing protein
MSPANTSPSLSPHTRLALGLFAGLLVAMIALGYTVFMQLVEREEQQIVSTLNHVADVQTAAVSTWVEERTRDAAVFAGGRFLGETMHEWISRGAPDDATRVRIAEQLQAIKHTYDYLEAAIVDPDGNVYLSTEEAGATSPMLTSAIAHATLQEAVSSNRPRVSTIHGPSGPDPNRRVVDLATPLLDMYERSGKAASVLLMRANAGDRLQPFVSSMPLIGAATEVVLAEIIDQHVMATSTSRNTVHFIDFGPIPIEPEKLRAAARAEGGEDGAFELASAGSTSIAVAREVQGAPWYLIAMVDREAARANIVRLAWLVALVGGGALSLSGLALALWTREKESRYQLESRHAAAEKALLQRRYDYLSKYANDMIIVTDRDGTMQEVNDKTLQLLGLERQAVVGQPIRMLFLPACAPDLERAFGDLRASGEARFEVLQRGFGGQLLALEASARALERDGRYNAHFVFRDVSERRQSETALRDSQDRLNGILTSIRDVVWSFSPDLSHLNYINEAVERVYGYPAHAFEERPQLWLETVHPHDRGNYQRMLAELSAEQPLYDAEHRIVARDGEVHWLHCRGRLVTDEAGNAIRIDGVSADITQKKQAEQQVQLLAYYDSLTMLPNRALLYDRLAQALPMAARTERKVALLFMDLDNFKNINDSLGHHIGDLLLRAIAERLLHCVREEDTVARIGGDEFLIVLPDIDKGAQAVTVADKVLAATSSPFMVRGHEIHTTITIGISIFPDDAQEVSELIRHADSALYQAKALGRNTYQFFTPELNYQITRSSEIERRLRQAIDSGDLRLWYQPQVDPRNGRLIGGEALARWRVGEREFLSPLEFIPVAEERGLIGRIGEWALREACTQCRRWQAQGLEPVPIAVNVSPIQFQQKGFVDLVTGILNETGLEGRFLELEITESALMRNAPEVAALTTRLRQLGIGISIDDFGTGYSSLSYLRQIPIDKIKIDRSFISDMMRDGGITRAIVQLAQSLNLRVIAEGVESRAQIDRLHVYGCDAVQGHYYSSAVPADAFAYFLARHHAFRERPESVH